MESTKTKRATKAPLKKGSSGRWAWGSRKDLIADDGRRFAPLGAGDITTSRAIRARIRKMLGRAVTAAIIFAAIAGCKPASTAELFRRAQIEGVAKCQCSGSAPLRCICVTPDGRSGYVGEMLPCEAIAKPDGGMK